MSVSPSSLWIPLLIIAGALLPSGCSFFRGRAAYAYQRIPTVRRPGSYRMAAWTPVGSDKPPTASPSHRSRDRAAGADTRAPVRTSRAVLTSGSARVTIEQFMPSGEGRHPVILILHGAGGPVGYRIDYEQYGKNLAQHGYGVLFAHYFEKTGTTPMSLWLGGKQRLEENFQAWMVAVQDAITYAQRLPEAGPDRIGLLGYSLGGYLALSVATRDARVGAVAEFFGGLPEQFAEQANKLPPVLILHGDADPVVPVSEAYNLERRLKSAGRPLEMQIYKGSGHGFQGEAAEDAARRTLQFFQRYLKS